MNPIRTSAGFAPAPRVADISAVTSHSPELLTLSGVPKMYLIHEALSRARMRRPQADRTITRTEATRSARSIAIEARRRAARDLGSL